LRVWGFAAALAVAVGCGSSPELYVRIEAPLLVPQACDGVTVHVSKPDAGTAFDQTYDLATANLAFPVSLLLDAASADDLGVPLTVTATALKNNSPATAWATTQQSVTLTQGQLTTLTLELCDCTP
jgi:hypothetical protein